MPKHIKALLFDVFGTVVDWRGAVLAELAGFFDARGVARDWEQFALDWRALYQPAMQAVRDGTRDFVILDVLHRENLLQLVDRYRIEDLGAADLDHLTRIWHRLTPWPDSAAGLAGLRAHRIVATCSNGNIALMVGLARYGGLTWDAILGAEVTRAYKPDPRTYLGSAAALGLAPEECMMVAAHNDDLRAAKALGLATAFVARPREYGPGQTIDLKPEGDWDYTAKSLEDLAAMLQR